MVLTTGSYQIIIEDEETLFLVISGKFSGGGEEPMRLAEAQQLLLNTYTLTVDIADDVYYSARHDGEHFLLGYVYIGQPASRLLQEADWQIFYDKVPQLLKDSALWMKG